MKQTFLNSLQVGDIVLCHAGDIYEIIKLTKVNYQAPDEEYDFEWLEFECEVLYTNCRKYKDNMNEPALNCKGMFEKINENVMKAYISRFSLFKNEESNCYSELDIQ